MRLVIQRVVEADVTIEGECVGAIGEGLLVLIGVAQGDTDRMAERLAEKTVNLRIFADTAGKMNRSLLDTKGSVLVVSQFTLLGDARKGNRPSFVQAAPPEEGERLYRLYAGRIASCGVPVAQGRFGAEMKVRLVNDGPVTILLEMGQE